MTPKTFSLIGRKPLKSFDFAKEHLTRKLKNHGDLLTVKFYN